MIFWGLVIVFVDYHIGRFNVAPDFIGYALIVFGAHTLGQYTRGFLAARNVAMPLIPLSLWSYGRPPPLPAGVEITDAVLLFCMMWCLLGAVITFCEERYRPVFADYARIYRRIYAGIAILAFLFEQAARFEPEIAGGYVNLAYTASLVLLILILWLLHQIRDEFSEPLPRPWPQ